LCDGLSQGGKTKINVTQSTETVPVMVMHLQGKLDGSNYMDVVTEAERIYKNGTRNLLLNLSDLT